MKILKYPIYIPHKTFSLFLLKFILILSHDFQFYSVGYSALIYYYCAAQIIPDLTSSSPFKMVLYPFAMSPSFFEKFLIFQAQEECSRVIFYFPFPYSGTSYFSKKFNSKLPFSGYLENKIDPKVRRETGITASGRNCNHKTLSPPSLNVTLPIPQLHSSYFTKGLSLSASLIHMAIPKLITNEQTKYINKGQKDSGTFLMLTSEMHAQL